MSEQAQFTDNTGSRVSTEQNQNQALSQEAYGEMAKQVPARTATEKLEQSGVIPKVEWDVEPEKELTPKQKKEFEQRLIRQGHVQDLLLTYVQYVHGDESGSLSPANKLNVERQKKLILDEASKGEFGPASKKAFGEVIDWLEKRAIPGRINALKAYESEIPATEFLSGNQPAKLRLDAKRLPSELDVKDLDSIAQFFKQTGDKLNQVDLKQKQDLIKWIKDNNLPKGWLPEEGADMNKWFANASRLVRTYHDSLACAGVMHYLNQAGEGVIFQQATPPGSKINPDGVLENAALSMPLDWKLSSSADKAKLESLENWTEQSKKKLAPFLNDLQTVAEHSERLTQWGDEDLRGRKVLFDKDNNLIGIVGKDEPLKPGQHTMPANLLEGRYDVEEVGGKIVVTQNIQAQNSHWYSYQNMVGVDDVGNKITIRREHNPDDYVMVKHGGEIVLMKASDLRFHKGVEQTMHYGGKTLTAALDVSMLVTGTIEVAGAYRALKGAQVATGVLTRFAAREALTESEKMLLRTGTKQFIVNGMRASVGATGFLNNAAFSDSPTAQNIQAARGIFIVADLASTTVGASKKVETFLANHAKLSSETVGLTRGLASAAGKMGKVNTVLQVPTVGGISATVVYEKSLEAGTDNSQRAASVAYRDNLLNQDDKQKENK